jgi:recombination protein RecA
MALASVPWRMAALTALEVLPTRLEGVDRLMGGGFPRGGLTEICGPASSGRTSLALAALATATAEGECCAYVDTDGVFDPQSAAEAGVKLERLLWVRCAGSLENALRCADLVVQAGGFGAVVFDLGRVPPETARRIPAAHWFRLRRAVEGTRTALLIVAQQPNAKAAASRILEMRRGGLEWSGGLLQGARRQATLRKPVRPETVCLEWRAVG